MSWKGDETLDQVLRGTNLSRWKAWLAESDKLNTEIVTRRQGEALDVDALWEAARADLEARNSYYVSQ